MPDPTITNLDLTNLPASGEPPKTEAATRPDHIPEKFWDAEKGQVRVDDLVKSYTELEKARPAAPAKDPAEKPQIPTDPAQKIVTDAGLDWGAVQKQVVETGKLDDAAIVAIEKLGVPREMIDGYLEMAKEVSASINTQALAHVGGEEAMAGLMDWAGKNLPDARKQEFNARLATRDGWKDALSDLMALRTAASKTNGEPDLTSGGRAAPSGAAGYDTREEMMKDMADPRYGLQDPSKADPKFRAMVAEKMQATLGRR